MDLPIEREVEETYPKKPTLKNGVWSWSELCIGTLAQNMMTRIKNFEKKISIGRLFII